MRRRGGKGKSMAFKQAPPAEIVPDSPEKILLELPRRKIPGVLLHQGQMMQRYVADAQDKTDVALQLPTGNTLRRFISYCLTSRRQMHFRCRAATST